MFKTVCPRNCYSTCSLKVYVENNKICRIESNQDNLATPKGTCLRGLSYVERTHSKDRIIYPMKKNKNKGGFTRISWNEALDTIAEKLDYYKREFGPQSVLYYSASGTKGLMNEIGSNFWKLYGGYTTTYGDLCWPAGLEATRLTLGENKHNVPWDIENAKLIILWGKNPAETNIQQMRSIDKAIEKGSKLIAIDPRRTLSAEQAELILQPRPGTDGALALAVGHLLIKWDKLDHEFIERYILGFDEYKKLVEDFSPEKASKITDVPARYIRKLSELIAESGPVSFLPGFGMQRYTNSGQAFRAILSLAAITGNIGKPGAGWLYANLQSSIFDKIVDPLAFFPPEKPDGISRVSISTARLGSDMLKQTEPSLKMAWVERGNPITQNPDTNTVIKAFKKLDFRVVVDQFYTDTALMADIILPAKSMFEQSDIIGAYWHPYIQLKRKVIDPPGEVKPESEIYWILAKKLGFSKTDIRDCLPEPTDSGVEIFLNKKLEPFPKLSLEELKEGPVIAPGTQEIAYSDLKFKTPSGKIELYSREAKDRWGLDPLPVYSEPLESISSNSKKLKKYPLYFITPNTKNSTHSQFQNLKLIRQFGWKPFMTIAPEDAEERNVSNKERVRVFNDRGSLEVEARIDFGIKKGCVYMTNGWWITVGGTVNFLSFGRETDMGHGTAFHDNLVQIEKLKKT